MKRRIFWTAATVGVLLAGWFVDPMGAATKTAAYLETVQTFTARKTFSGGINSRNNYDSADSASVTGLGTIALVNQSVDGAMVDPAVAPTLGGQTGASGCANGGIYQLYVAFYSPGGNTNISPASAQFTVSGSNANIIVNEPAPPAGANSWRAFWARSTDGFVSKKNCALGTGGLTSIGTTTINCACNAAGGAAPTSNSSTAIPAMSLTDGLIKAASYGASPQYLMTAATYQLGLNAPAPTWSVNSGSTVVGVLTTGGNLKTVCASGCQYTTVASALSSISGATASNRFTVLLMPGVYWESVTVGSYTTLAGLDRTNTVLRRVTTSGGAQSVALQNMWLADGIRPGNNRATPTTLGLFNMYIGSFDINADFGQSSGMIFGTTYNIDCVDESVAGGSPGGGTTIYANNVLCRSGWDGWAIGPDSILYSQAVSTYIQVPAAASGQAGRCWGGFNGYLRLVDRGGYCSVSLGHSDFGSNGFMAGVNINNESSQTITARSLVDLQGTSISLTSTSGSMSNGSDKTGCLLVKDVVAGGGSGVVTFRDVSCSITAGDASQVIDAVHLASDSQLSGWTVLWDGGEVSMSGGATRNDVKTDEATVTSITLRGLRHSGVYTGSGTAVTVQNSTLPGGIVRSTAAASPPASCIQGDHYVDTSGADCTCTTTGTPGTWTNNNATGTCA